MGRRRGGILGDLISLFFISLFLNHFCDSKHVVGLLVLRVISRRSRVGSRRPRWWRRRRQRHTRSTRVVFKGADQVDGLDEAAWLVSRVRERGEHIH